MIFSYMQRGCLSPREFECGDLGTGTSLLQARLLCPSVLALAIERWLVCCLRGGCYNAPPSTVLMSV